MDSPPRGAAARYGRGALAGVLGLAACRSAAPAEVGVVGVTIPAAAASVSAAAPARSVAPLARGPSRADAEGLMAAIARDIQGLGRAYPQLADFDPAWHFDREGLVISYSHHSHGRSRGAGWGSGVPAPAPDGIMLYLDLHDPDSTAQIHTQPAVPMIDVLGRKLMLIVLEGSAAHPAEGDLRAIVAREIAALGPPATPAASGPSR